MFRVATELQNVRLRDAHVFENLPGSVGQSFDALTTLIGREVFDDIFESDVRAFTA